MTARRPEYPGYKLEHFLRDGSLDFPTQQILNMKA
jgi:hypothetical protein